MKTLNLLTIFACIIAMTLSSQKLSAQASNQPTVDGVDIDIALFDNMLYHMLPYASGPLPLREQILYKKAEFFFTKHPECTFETLSKDNQFLKYVNKQGFFFTGGPMLGNVRSDGVDVWVRTIKSEIVKIEAEADGETISFASEPSSPNSDYSVVVNIKGLKPDTWYNYRVFVGDNEIERDTDFRFKTLPIDNNTDTRIIVGADYHRFGLSNVQLADQMVSRNAHAFLAIGDIAVQDKMNIVGYHCLDFLARDMYPAWQNLSSKLPVYATWDDHDYMHDDWWNTAKHLTSRDKESIWRVFRNNWANPSYGFGENGKGVFLRTQIGAADVIMVDNRYFRENGSLLGKQQTEWLKEQLLDCKSPFIIITCGTMFSDYVSGGKDSWGVYSPKVRDQIFDLIEENNIGGVLLVSGDRHGSRGFTINRKSGFKFYEFGVGSLGGLGGQPAKTDAWKDVQFYGESEIFAFGEFTFDTKLKDPTATFRLIKEDGSILCEKTLTRSELTPKSK